METETKVCRKCYYEKPITEFTITDRARGYRKSQCKPCEYARIKAYYAANPQKRIEARNNAAPLAPKTPEQTRKHMLKYKYGITEDQYDALREAQRNRCALCKGENVGSGQWANGYWHIDHDHNDGHVRGLLCQQCNTRLGGYEGLLEQAGEDALLDYLTRPCPVPAAPPPVIVPEYRKVEVLPVVRPGRKPRVFTVCSVDGCEKPEKEAGYCGMHYQRIQRVGEPGSAEHLPHTSAKGDAHWKSGLTAADVRFIRNEKNLSGAALARMFGVTRASISAIRAHKTWKHVTDA